MPKATLRAEPPPEKTWVTLKDGKTGKSKCTTVYGLRPDQVLEALKLGIEATNKKDAAHAA